MRISTQAAAQSALMDLMRAQRDSFDAREQLATGKKAPALKGFGHQAETILSARGALERSESFTTAAKRLQSRLDVQDLALNEMSDAVAELRTSLTTNDGTYLMTEVRESFERVVTALNTRFNGSYVFSGTRTDAAAFTGQTLADLQAAPSIASLFGNSDRKQTAMIEEEVTVEVAPLAEDFAADVMAIFERIADFDAGPDGPFDGAVTPAQQAFLQTEIANAIAAFDEINDTMAKNGAMQERLEKSIEAQTERTDYLTLFLADLEDADMAEAATRFQQAQTAVDVSARTFATLSQVSLLPFLR